MGEIIEYIRTVSLDKYPIVAKLWHPHGVFINETMAKQCRGVFGSVVMISLPAHDGSIMATRVLLTTNTRTIHQCLTRNIIAQQAPGMTVYDAMNNLAKHIVK